MKRSTVILPQGDFLCGIVEGYYGRTWSHQDRLDYAQFLPQLGLNSFLYCPKSDPYLRKQWFAHWPLAQWQQLLELSAKYREQGLLFGLGLSPFELYRHYGAKERQQLKDKVQRIQELHPSLLALLFDDMPGAVVDLAERQAEIIADVQAWAPELRLLMCPTYYSTDPVLEKHFGPMPAEYWSRLGTLLAEQVEVFWTGPKVCSESISCADLVVIQAAFGRPVTLWDNYPVNDGAVRSDKLYLEPLSQRSPKINQHLAGHFCNPMNQAQLSLPALRGLAELYSNQLPQDLEAQLLGEELWRQLAQDRHAFQYGGLSGLGELRRQELSSRYARFTGPAAAELVSWLQGEYTFDPACLTD